MDWHEEWVNEFIKRGGTKQMAETKSVAMFRDIISEAGDKYTQAAMADAELLRAKNELARVQADLDRTRARASLEKEQLKYELEKTNREISSQWETCKVYLDSFFEALKDCETAEGRDAMRRAQMFVNTVELNTVYDNTAFIVGLAAILSKGEIGAIEEFKKIDPKLFDADAEWGKERMRKNSWRGKLR